MRFVYNTLLLVFIAILIPHIIGAYPPPIGEYTIYLWYVVAALVSLLITSRAWIRFRYDLHKIPLTKDMYSKLDFPKYSQLDLFYENKKHAARNNPPVTKTKGLFSTLNVHDYSLFHAIQVAGINSYKPSYRFKRIIEWYTYIFGGITVASACCDEWKWRKTALAPYFQTHTIVPNLLPYVVEKGKSLLHHFEATLGEHVEVDGMFTNATLDIIFKYITGEDRSDVDRAIQQKSVEGETFRKMFSGLSYLALPQILFGRPYRIFLPSTARNAGNHLQAYCAKVIDYVTAKYNQKDSAQYIPPLAKLAKAGDYKWTTKKGHKNLIADFNILLFAGHDTTAHTLSFLMYELGRNPAVQARVFKEVRQAFGPPANAQISPETISNLPILSAVIRETLRYHTIVPNLIAQTAVDTIIGGYKLPKGTQISLDTLAICYDPRYFDEPDLFNIDRWLTDSNKEFYEDSKADVAQTKRNPDVTFNLGAHTCLGRNLALLELRVLAAMIVNSYEVAVAKYFDLKFSREEVLLKPANGMYLSFKTRK